MRIHDRMISRVECGTDCNCAIANYPPYGPISLITPYALHFY